MANFYCRCRRICYNAITYHNHHDKFMEFEPNWASENDKYENPLEAESVREN